MVSFLDSLKTSEFVTLIGILFTLFIGIVNVFISSHKNRLETITQNRMKWIYSVRELAAAITSWRCDESLKELRQNINQLILFLNVSNSIDNEIIDHLLKMYDAAYELSFYKSMKSTKAQRLYEAYYDHRKSVRTFMRIYLKMEWTRVKVESTVWRIPFRLYWIPFWGFNEKWATASLTRKFEKIKTYDFEPWMVIDIDEDMDMDRYNIITINKDEVKIPSELIDTSFKRLISKSSKDETVKVADVHLG